MKQRRSAWAGCAASVVFCFMNYRWGQFDGSGFGGTSEFLAFCLGEARRLVLRAARADLLDGPVPGEAADVLGAVAS